MGRVLASLSAALMVSDEQKLHLGSQDQLEPRTVVKAPSSLPSPPCPLPVSEDVWSMLDAPTPQHWKWILSEQLGKERSVPLQIQVRVVFGESFTWTH